MVIQYFYKRVYEPESLKNKGKYRGARVLSLALAVGSYIGWRIGYNVANKEELEKYLTKFEDEDQIYDILNKTKKPVFLYYYVPGDWFSIFFRQHFLKCARDHNDKMTFMKINCAQHYDVCRNKNLDDLPRIFLHRPVIEKKNGEDIMKGFDTVNFRKDLGSDGIKAFLQENEIIPKEAPHDGLYEYVYSKVYKQS